MGLNIKNERVHRLARQAAEVTGKTQTGAIEEALVRLLAAYEIDPERQQIETRLDAVHRIVAEWEQAPSGKHAIMRVEDLYDADTGLPR